MKISKVTEVIVKGYNLTLSDEDAKTLEEIAGYNVTIAKTIALKSNKFKMEEIANFLGRLHEVIYAETSPKSNYL